MLRLFRPTNGPGWLPEYTRSIERALASVDQAGLQSQINVLEARIAILEGATGWGEYTHTGSTQSLTASTKAALVNNKGGVLEVQKPTDVGTLYDGTVITGRNGDSILGVIEMTFTPDDAVASNLFVAIDIGGAVGEIYPEDFTIALGAGLPHIIRYAPPAYTLNTWEANGGTIRVEADGDGVISDVRYVIHRLHKAR